MHVIAAALGVFSLYCTVTNLVPLSVGFAPLIVLVPVLFVGRRRYPEVVFSCACMLAYFAISTLIYYAPSFLQYEFYRYDGNVFTSYAPIMIYGLLSIRVRLQPLIRRFLLWVTLVDVVFIVIYAATGSTIFVSDPGIYHFLFFAHNAAGGFLSVATALALGEWWVRRGWREFCWMAVNGLGMALTLSVGSFIGFGMAVLIVLVMRERWLWLLILGYVALLAALLSYTYPIWEKGGEIPSQTEYGGQAQVSGGATTDFDEAPHASHVIARIFFLWPRAVDNWLHSPIFGLGFGSYNDTPTLGYSGWDGVAALAKPGSIQFDDSHAHHTYLHVLAETGLLGLSLLLWMLYAMWKFIHRLEPMAVRYGLLLAFWTAVWSATTEHRLFAPAEMLPFTILMGLALANANWLRRQARRERAPLAEAA
ncbi:MAG: O-antigen ligase family protein [Candidatus Binataceae bacterium]